MHFHLQTKKKKRINILIVMLYNSAEKYWLDTAQQPPSGFDLDKVEAKRNKVNIKTSKIYCHWILLLLNQIENIIVLKLSIHYL